MFLSDYHKEFFEEFRDKPLSSFLEIIEEHVSKNDYWSRCQNRTSNSGLCKIVEEFKGYVDRDEDPPKDREILFKETAYVFWLLGERESKHSESLQKRISQSTKGASYYQQGEAGFRQFEFELHTISRLVEEGIDFDDIEGNKMPDLLVHYEELSFPLEIKMPTSSLSNSLSDALGKLFQEWTQGAIVIGADFLMAGHLNDLEYFGGLCDEVESKLTEKPVASYIEYFDPSARSARADYFAGEQVERKVLEALHVIETGEATADLSE